MNLSKAFAIAAISIFSTTSAMAETATFAGGCFWCVEADMESVEGVGDAISGFTGGTTRAPAYGQSGDHIEAVAFPFDESVVSYRQLVDLFLRSIDPFDAGGQFCDRGLEYTSAIFVNDAEQDRIAREAIQSAQADLGREIVTPIMPTSEFFAVGAYHQDYYKSDDRLAFSSVGIGVKKSDAYNRYRKGCGRDERVRSIWGDAAPFVKTR
jgi:peptide-methionine (S)-S-oxide reductase